MVFSRKQEPSPATSAAVISQKRSGDRSVIAHAQHTATHAPAESVIGNDLSIEGDTITIRCKGSLRVNGDIQADLHSQELEVGREGRITGSIAADTVNVFGHVSGAILGSQVILHATAEVDGDIHSNNLAIESGASFDGRSRKAREGDNIRPQLEKPSSESSAHPSIHNGASMHATQQPQSSVAASPFGSQDAQPSH